jgi:general secretion pathway protein J
MDIRTTFRCGARARGFTLIELLVALLVFSVLAVTGYRGLDALLKTRAHVDQETRKYQALSRFFTRLDGQIGQAIARPVRLADGKEQAAWLGLLPAASALEDAQLTFTRAGGMDTDGLPIPPQRVGYRLRGHSIQLLRWPVLDRAPSTRPLVDDVLEGVAQFNLRYLSSTAAWVTQWPVSAAEPLPKGVEVELVLTNGEKVVRLFSLQ